MEAVIQPTCRICGCTDEEPCDGPCGWVEGDLCSECAPVEFLLRSETFRRLAARVASDLEEEDDGWQAAASEQIVRLAYAVGELARRVMVEVPFVNLGPRPITAADLLREGRAMHPVSDDLLYVASVALRWALAGDQDWLETR
jgi:hypothetical protein